MGSRRNNSSRSQTDSQSLPPLSDDAPIPRTISVDEVVSDPSELPDILKLYHPITNKEMQCQKSSLGLWLNRGWQIQNQSE